MGTHRAGRKRLPSQSGEGERRNSFDVRGNGGIIETSSSCAKKSFLSSAEKKKPQSYFSSAVESWDGNLCRGQRTRKKKKKKLFKTEIPFMENVVPMANTS